MRVDLAEGATVKLAIRPEAWQRRLVNSISAPVQDGVPRCTVQGTVRYLESLGPETLVYVALTHQSEPVVARVEPDLARGLQLGESIVLEVDASRVLAFNEEGQRIDLQTKVTSPAALPENYRAAVYG